MVIRAIISDWDGTTLNSWPQALRIIREIFSEFGAENIKTKESRLRYQWGYAAAEAFNNVLPNVDYELIEAAWTNKLKAADKIEPLELIPGALKTFDKLSECGITITLLTNRKAKHLAANLPPSADLNSMFAAVQTYMDLKRGNGFLPGHPSHITSQYAKPDRRAFRPTLRFLKREFGIEHNEIVSVGDALVDLEVANANNIMFVGVLTGAVNTKNRWLRWSEQKGLSIAEYQIIPSITHLPDWIEQYGK